jgi:arylsulfatase A-like enzyme
LRTRVALATALLAAAACGEPPPGRTLLLLSVDTLRADRLGAYGGARGTSPELDRLAAESVVFCDCTSVSSWTMPAMGTLATGLRPSRHGMVYWHLPLGDVEETLSETLARAGVRSAFFGNPIPALAGLDRGFETWETFEGDDAAAVDRAVRWLRTTGGDRFVWVHLLSPHAPYDPAPGMVRPDPELDPRTVLYDGEVRTVDRLAGRLLDAVDGDAAVIVTADHGETLDERAELAYDHGKFLFEELVRIPCTVRVPGARPRVESLPVTLADLPVTVCDWFGASVPAGAYGVSLLPAVREGAPGPRGTTFAWVVEDDPPRHTDRRWSVRTGSAKAVFDVSQDTARLFDLDADPQEVRDLAGVRPETVERLRGELDAWRRAAPPPRIPFEKSFTRAELERLRSLGYLGGAD